MKVAAGHDRTHNPFDEAYRVSRLKENFTSGSDGEGLETGLRSTLTGHARGNPGYRQEHSYGLPRQSFTRQTAFQHLEQDLNSEIDTLAYPRAALFGFCVALVADNVFAVVLAVLRSAHDDQTVDETVSSYALAEELGTTYRGMMIAIPPAQWVCFQAFTVIELATLLKQLAGAIRLSAFRKKRRGPKKPSVKKPYNAKRPHVSAAKALAAAAAKNSSP